VFSSIAAGYLFMKLVYLYSLVRIQVRHDPMRDRWMFLGSLYTAGVAFLSYVLIVSWQTIPWAPWQRRIAWTLGVSPWLAWVLETLLISALYFRLMAKFDEGVIFWVLLLLGLVVVGF
jgi:hypothetical protein